VEGQQLLVEMGDEKEYLVSEESRLNYGSFLTNESGKRLYHHTTQER
jgi:hypothetical protein